MCSTRNRTTWAESSARGRWRIFPLNGRNFLQLSLLSGAAVTPQGAAAGSTGQTGHPLLAINVAGNEPDYTMYVDEWHRGRRQPGGKHFPEY